ncbi:MAG TPA: hypothetical protein DCL44_12550 [Elusimicrobia bacterium]|nr:hypothetical protein [Elusimicrobiota bacterium]
MIPSLAIDIPIIVIFLFLSLAVGRRAINKLLVPGNAELIVSVALGLFIISYATLLLGYAGLLYAWIFRALAVIGLFVERKSIYAAANAILLRVRKLEFSRHEKYILAALIVPVVFNFLYNYCPPVADDEIATHLAMPAMWEMRHAIYSPPGMHAQYMPLGISMLYTCLTVLGKIQTARFFHYILGLLCLGALYILGRKVFDRTTALLGCLIFYSMPMTASLSGVAYTDFGTLLYALVSVYCFLEWRGKGESVYLYLSAICAGAQICGKYTAYPLIAILPACVIFDNKMRICVRLKYAIIFLVLAGLMFSPYLIRNTILTGNPLYPAKILGLNYNEILYHIYLNNESSVSDLISLILSSDKYAVIWGTGPLFLAFIPFVAFIKNRTRELYILLAISVFTFLLLYLGHISWMLTRHSILSFALLSPVAALVIRELSGREGLRRFVPATVIAALASGMLFSAYFGIKRIPVFLGIQSKEDYFSTQYDIAENSDMVGYINKHIPPGSGIFFLGFPTPPNLNYLNFRAYGMDMYPVSFYAGGINAVMSDFRQRNIQYMVYLKGVFREDSGSVIYDVARPIRINWFKKEYFDEIWSNKSAILYKII